MKFFFLSLAAISLACISCERHNLEETKHLYEPHGHDHGDHGDHGHSESKDGAHH